MEKREIDRNDRWSVRCRAMWRENDRNDGWRRAEEIKLQEQFDLIRHFSIYICCIYPVYKIPGFLENISVSSRWSATQQGLQTVSVARSLLTGTVLCFFSVCQVFIGPSRKRDEITDLKTTELLPTTSHH